MRLHFLCEKNSLNASHDKWTTKNGNDYSHGWLLTHPLRKLQVYQQYIIAFQMRKLQVYQPCIGSTKRKNNGIRFVYVSVVAFLCKVRKEPATSAENCLATVSKAPHAIDFENAFEAKTHPENDSGVTSLQGYLE